MGDEHLVFGNRHLAVWAVGDFSVQFQYHSLWWKHIRCLRTELQVPTGEKLSFGDKDFMKFEEAGVQEASQAAFVLVAGGLGERLGYSGIKVILRPFISLLAAVGKYDQTTEYKNLRPSRETVNIKLHKS